MFHGRDGCPTRAMLCLVKVCVKMNYFFAREGCACIRFFFVLVLQQAPKEEDEEENKKKKMEVEEKEEEEEKPVVLSKRKRKLLSRLSVAQLKQLVKRPDVVEVSLTKHRFADQSNISVLLFNF